MARISFHTEQRDDILVYPSPFSPQNSSNFVKEPNPPPQSASRINPAVLLVIVILALIFFISGLLHLLVRILMKRPYFSSISQSNRYPEQPSNTHALQRQLQQLFRLHDSGLDQALIDALPVFFYKDIMGLKDPFDCAVCLCEFSGQDRLRLLPKCSHAFHINCIGTWLLTNSTCPLCRSTIVSSGEESSVPGQPTGFSMEESSFSIGESSFSGRENTSGRRVLPVMLGKFRTLNGGRENGEEGEGEGTSCKLDARRCYSLGSYQYMVVQTWVDLSIVEVGGQNGNSAMAGDVEGKRICEGSKGESFSISKVWLWSKKGKYPSSSSHVTLEIGNRRNGV
ncbi:hypothetical protein NMG60_11004408 [Bertholletia excelsa]